MGRPQGSWEGEDRKRPESEPGVPPGGRPQEKMQTVYLWSAKSKTFFLIMEMPCTASQAPVQLKGTWSFFLFCKLFWDRNIQRTYFGGFPDGSDDKESACNAGDGFDPWVGKITWRREWGPSQYSCLENPIDRGAWWATVHGVTKRRTQLRD